MSKILKPIHPSKIKKWMKLFTEEGRKVEVLDIYCLSGKYYWQVFYNENGENKFLKYEYDCHVYNDEGGDPLHKLYRKKTS